MQRLLAPVPLSLVLLTWLVTGCPGSGSGSRVSYQVGDVVQDAALPGLDGSTLQLSSLRGKVVLINFWATWCPPCRAEIPQLEAHIWRPWRERGLVVLGVDREEDAATVRPFVDEVGITYPVLLDPQRDVYSRFTTRFVPWNAVLDREQRLIYSAAGYDEAALLAVIEAQLGGAAPPR